MFFKLFFRRMPLHKKVNFLRKKGIMLGTRVKEGRKIHIYMFRDLFVEVIFENDDPNGTAENLKTVTGLSKLNDYLEQEFKTSF